MENKLSIFYKVTGTILLLVSLYFVNSFWDAAKLGFKPYSLIFFALMYLLPGAIYSWYGWTKKPTNNILFYSAWCYWGGLILLPIMVFFYGFFALFPFVIIQGIIFLLFIAGLCIPKSKPVTKKEPKQPEIDLFKTKATGKKKRR